jgi:hypothetical protein
MLCAGADRLYLLLITVVTCSDLARLLYKLPSCLTSLLKVPICHVYTDGGQNTLFSFRQIRYYAETEQTRYTAGNKSMLDWNI